ncbi:MAG TPA: hypothetical protein VF796_11085 [Humisphaera sp.]
MDTNERSKVNYDPTVTPGKTEKVARDSNPDPITGAPGSHPGGTAVGTTAGGLAGAAAGAALGSVVPGVGTVIGAAVGILAGGAGGAAVGHNVAENINPTREDAYWRENHKTQPYYSSHEQYDYDTDYAPAYRYGWESRSQHAGKTYDAAESDLERGWENAKGKSRLGWDKAKDATRSAWHKVERALPGDADRDGR